jgi:hypothetical protein
LIDKLESEDADRSEIGNELVVAVSEAGDVTLPALQAALNRKLDEEAWSVILTAASYLGGPDARAMLRREFDRSKGHKKAAAKAALCAVMVSTDSVENRRFLLDTLKDRADEDNWFPIMAAVCALGILRAEEARPALQALARTDDGTFVEYAAQEVLSWMDVGHYAVPSWMDETDEGRIQAAVLRNGIPNTSRSPSYRDGDACLVWSKQGNVWQAASTGQEPEDLPTLSFEIRLIAGGTSAIVSITVYYGPKDATGYDYVLRKSAGRWHVTAMFFTWIS